MNPVLAEYDGCVWPVDLARYPDGTHMVKFAPTLWPRRILVRPRDLGEFAAAMFWVDSIYDRGGEVPELILPLVPGQRQDRLNPRGVGDQLFTLKSVAEMINARCFPRVVVLDPHSDVTPALIDRCVAYKPADLLDTTNEYAAVIAPDAGAEKRAAGVAQKLRVPLLRAWKTRDVATGKLTEFGVESHDPCRVLVVDDLCDAGGTFVGLGKVLADIGDRADLWVTHGLFTQGTTELGWHYDRIYTTDSVLRLPAASPGFSEMNICGQLLTKGTL